MNRNILDEFLRPAFGVTDRELREKRTHAETTRNGKYVVMV
jgi:hypothetical protein